MPELVSTMLPLLAILAVFWLIVIRPASRRNRELARLHSALGPGDEVMLSSGIYGIVSEIVGDRLRLEIAPSVRIEVAKGAVASRVAPENDPEAGPDAGPDAAADAPEER